MDGWKEAWGDEVRAHGTADSVVVEGELRLELGVDGGPGVLDNVAGPCAASAGGVEALPTVRYDGGRSDGGDWIW